ncbi:TIGR02679 family protein [Variovorax sp. LT1R16]|uniref:TIGR02679 family protein n=1 Tax=Variovorax sp. LT1R16 TaxID=3443728 RepID=UPI003F47A597
MTPEAKLQRLLGGPALAPLRQRLRRYFERNDNGNARASLQLTQLNATEHEALALLTGRPARNVRSRRIDVAVVDASLQAAGLCGSLREALERLDGPISNPAAERDASRLAWAALSQGSQRDRDARLQAWLQTLAAGTLLKRLARQDTAVAETLLVKADAVIRCLPAAGLPRAQLAAQMLGNAHALDAGQPVSTLVLAAWRFAEAAAAKLPRDEPPELEKDPEENQGEEPEQPAEDTRLATERARDTWARAGILVNELARPALMLNLPLDDGAMAGWTPGEPAYLSLRQLLRTPPAWAVEGRLVFVCENPNLLAIAADRLGARCAPMVCIDGMPAAAQRTLLNQLLHAGAQLRYHGDFDWPGLQIANHVMRTWHAKPWRLATNDYEAAVRGAPHLRRDLAETNIDAAWDPLLAPAMRRHGLSIAEEAVADALIEDLQLT